MSRIFFVMMFVCAGFAAKAAESIPAEAQEILMETQGTTVKAEAPAAEAATPVAAVKEEPVKPLAEAEIPLNLEKKQQTTHEESPLLRVLFGVAVLGILGCGAFFLVRRHGKPGPRQNAPQIKVLTQHWMGPKKSLAIVRVAGESILIGVTDQNISMIKSLALLDEEVPEETPAQFNQVLGETNMRDKQIEENDGEEFQMGGLNQIKDAVSRRLKGMRSLQ